MKEFIEKFKRRLMIFLMVFGPGVITAVADNDAGGVATYTVGAARYGMNSQFLIIPITILLAVTQELGARIALVTKKGLGDLIRERYGIKLSFLIFFFYYIVNQGVIIQNISGLKASFQIFHLNWEVFLIITCILLIFFIVFFDYRKTQRIFFLMIFFYFSYIFSAFLAKPNWIEALRQSLIFPDKKYLPDLEYWFANIAILGTTITAWGQFFVHSYIIDKKLDVSHLKYETLEVYMGAFITNFFSWMMALAVTYTLFINGINNIDGFSAGLAMKPFAGDSAVILFALGLFGASILGLTIVPLATAYVFAEILGYEGSLDSSFTKGKFFYIFFTIQIIIGLFIVLFPNLNLFKITLYVDYLNGALLPVIFYFLLKFSEDPNIMGKYVTFGFKRFFVRISTVVITIAVLITFIGKILNLV